MAAPTLGLRHAVLWVSDPTASAEFYADVLGLETKFTSPDAVFMASPSSLTDHDLGLFRASIGAGSTTTGRAVPPLVGGPDARRPRRGATTARRARLVRRREQPRRQPQHLRPRSRRDRVRGDVGAAARADGCRRAVERPARPRGRHRPLRRRHPWARRLSQTSQDASSATAAVHASCRGSITSKWSAPGISTNVHVARPVGPGEPFRPRCRPRHLR